MTANLILGGVAVFLAGAAAGMWTLLRDMRRQLDVLRHQLNLAEAERKKYRRAAIAANRSRALRLVRER